MVKLLIYIYIWLVVSTCFNLSEKYESQLGLLVPIYGKITNVPNHQPDIYIYVYIFTFLYLDYYYIKILIHIVVTHSVHTIMY